ncbi:MAG: hypothetical protein ACREFE_09200 [Limisphaerales bacterium]
MAKTNHAETPCAIEKVASVRDIIPRGFFAAFLGAALGGNGVALIKQELMSSSLI